jgi:pseudouridine synthase
MDLVAGIREYLYPVGRLDFESEGLLLLTNDGDLAARLMHPRHGVARVYEVRVKGVPDARALKRLAEGIVLDGRRTAPAAVELIRAVRREGGQQSVLRLAAHEGRNRLVRRMCEAVGYPVRRLRRVQMGPLADSRLKPGQFRDLSPRELVALRRAAGIPAGAGLKPAPTGRATALKRAPTGRAT